jgi:glycosyltransferase involved in cell wall biosynthesis
MRIGIDIRLKDETGVGRYIRNLVSRIKTIDTRNEYVFIDPPVRWHSVREQIAMPSEYGKYDVDLVHIPYFNVPLAYNKPFIITIHDVIVDHFPTGRASTHPLIVYKLKRLAYKKIMKHAIAASKAVIVPSLTTKTALLDLYGTQFADKTQVIYEGVDANIALPVTCYQQVFLICGKCVSA